MSENVAKSKEYMKEIFSYVTLIVGAMIAAFSIEEFLVPCTILDGGVVGISIMINNLSKIPLGALTLVLNLPFLIAGMRKLGTKFIAKSAVAMVTFSSSLEIFASLTSMTQDYL
ncbi:MAG: YitT family protein, partial [Lachnospiraceae bacterium]|nr:YitT family protein [Lachnospiraceae bacterium]